MKQFLLITISLLFYISSCGQLPQQYIKTFFSEYESNPGNAIDNIYKSNPYATEMSKEINDMKEIANNHPKTLGKYYGHELITEHALSNHFALLSYFTKFDRQPMRFTFIFYRPGSEWRLYSLNFSANLDAELEQKAKTVLSTD